MQLQGVKQFEVIDVLCSCDTLSFIQCLFAILSLGETPSFVWQTEWIHIKCNDRTLLCCAEFTSISVLEMCSIWPISKIFHYAGLQTQRWAVARGKHKAEFARHLQSSRSPSWNVLKHTAIVTSQSLRLITFIMIATPQHQQRFSLFFCMCVREIWAWFSNSPQHSDVTLQRRIVICYRSWLWVWMGRCLWGI